MTPQPGSTNDNSAFNVINLLTIVFNDIMTHKLVPSSPFAEGWMCPLYKKNDKIEITNYRPITCLNTDYKIFTKCLATRLTDVAPSLIHPSQAGFILGQRITDQTKLIRLMMQYAKSTGRNGLIVALDQEKAYDKIASDLKGFDLQGHNEKLITNLFADDTTVFLSEGDDFYHLRRLLDNWCEASTARFNGDKTEIIPIGTKEFREEFIATRKLSQDSEEIPVGIHIVAEDTEGPWSIVLDKINANLARWERSNPTMEGRKLITSMVIGGMTQYLTQVKGMPKSIEKRITKTIREFVWKEKRSPVSEATLFLPTHLGGRALLDIVARNEAMEVLWLKSYLNMDENRPLWATVADALFAINVPKTEKNIDARVRSNIFLQSWKSSSTEKAGTSSDLRNMQKMAKKYGLRPEGIAFSKDITRLRPMWYHSDADKKLRRMNHGPTSECLKSNHALKTVGDTEQMASVTRCVHPHDCATKAEAMLNTLPEKWDPRRAPEAEADDAHVEEKDDEWTVLPIDLYTRGNLTDIFRIFTEGNTIDTIPRRLSQIDTGRELRATTDGSCFNNGYDNAFAGAGVYYSPEHQGNLSVKVPAKYTQSNQTAELLALKEAAEKAPQEARLHLELDSKYVIQKVSTRLRRIENEGFIDTKNAELIKLTIARLQNRETKTRVKWVKGHSSHAHNDGADALADEATCTPEDPAFNEAIEPNLVLTGAKLSCITQSLVYQAIRNFKTKNQTNQRARTRDHLEQIKDATEDVFEARPTTKAIWKGT
ncbi:hypothetical protein D9615_000306 [Tricholomella constricta]|uniref:RNase H type-1 domain-containing protein n=1 Tax=Tricholomella constricta TaxID=117010 RepID=A0A8H5HRF8_9AGAR|nr:hypothetical protein D9615_000306 [Tricholomella constricta]